MNFQGHEYQGIGRDVLPSSQAKCEFCNGTARFGYTPTVDGKIVGDEVKACNDHAVPAWEKALDAAKAHIRREAQGGR